MNAHTNTDKQPLVQIKQLQKQLVKRKGFLRRKEPSVIILEDISLDIYPGEFVCLVGEAGSGKTTLARTVLQLENPTGGTVVYQGQPLESLSKSALRTTRQQLQLLFPDPYKALSPHQTVGELIGEPLEIHGTGNGRSVAGQIADLLQEVGMNPYCAYRYPHEFSGGQRQRIAIARALATNPTLLVADDPTSALDSVVQQGIWQLLQRLSLERNMAVLLLTSSIAAACNVGDRIGLLLHGRLVELSQQQAVRTHPLHPYMQIMFSQLPLDDPTEEAKRQPMALQGQKPKQSNLPSGCHFHPRCPYTTDECRTRFPEWRDLGGETAVSHWVACHYAERFTT